MSLSELPEKAFFTKLLVGRNLSEYERLLAKGFRKQVFLPEVVPALDYVQAYYREYGELPTVTQFVKKFPDIGQALIADKVSDEHLFALYENIREFQLASAEKVLIQDAITLIKSKASPNVVLKSLGDSVGKVSARFSVATSEGGTYADLVAKNFDEILSGVKLVGMSVPLLFLHEQLGGLQKGEITTFAAPPGVGKTWLALMTVVTTVTGDPFYFYDRSSLPPDQDFLTDEQKKSKSGKCLVVSFEMTVVDITGRLLALFSRISYSRLMSGKLTKTELEQVNKHRQMLLSGSGYANNLKIVSLSECPDTDAVDALAHEFGADVVLLDAFYDMPGEGEKEWERIKGNLVKIRLNSLARNQHYILTSQLRRDIKGLEVASLDSLSFTSSIGHVSNNVIFAWQTNKERKDRQVELRLVKARKGEPTDIYLYNWDHKEAVYTEIGLKDDGSFSSDSY